MTTPSTTSSPATFRKVRIVSPYSRHLNCRIRSHEQNREITSFLSNRFPFRSAEEWSRRLTSGWITQGNRTLTSGDRIYSQPSLTLYHPEHHEPAVPDEVSVLQKTSEYLLVYKPAPMPVHPGGRYNKNTLTAILQDMGTSLFSNPGNTTKSDSPELTEIRLLHRLDSVTSGIVLLGLTHDFSRRVQLAFSDGSVEKNYLAVVSGNPADDFTVIDAPIKRKNGYIFECGKEGKTSITDFNVLKRSDMTSLILCRPRTGRTHQIRLHLREWGHPVIDDTVYSPDLHEAIPMQNRAISLLHFQMNFPGIGLNFRLPDSFINSFFKDSERSSFCMPLFSDAAKEYLSDI